MKINSKLIENDIQVGELRMYLILKTNGRLSCAISGAFYILPAHHSGVVTIKKIPTDMDEVNQHKEHWPVY